MHEHISVIIPLYNKEDTIIRAINSVLKQSYQSFEIIVVDDGSNDNSSRLVKEYFNEKIRLIYQENRGVSSARNKGAELSKYDLLAFLDADDEWREDFLETIISMNKKFPNASHYATGQRNKQLNIKKEIVNSYQIECNNNTIACYEFSYESFFATFSVKNYPLQTSAVVVSKELFFKSGRYITTQKHYEDWDLYYRLLVCGNLIYCPEQLSYKHNDSHQRISKNINRKLTKEQIGMIGIAELFFNNPSSHTSKKAKMFLFDMLLTIGINAALIGNLNLLNNVISCAKLYRIQSLKLHFINSVLIFKMDPKILKFILKIKILCNNLIKMIVNTYQRLTRWGNKQQF